MNQAWQAKYRLLTFDTIDSTNSEALRIAKNETTENLVIVAKSQTKGRGRAGKHWQSDCGNLYASILLNDINMPYDRSQLTLVTALAVHAVINDLLVKIENKLKTVLIKWPNDILVDNKKIAGVLLESIIVSGEIVSIIIGIGINITNHPNTITATTDLLAEGVKDKDYEIMQILDLLMISFDKYFAMWKNKGFLDIKEQWLKHAAGLGKLITIKSNDNQIFGIFEGLDDKGNIKIRDNRGALSIHLTGEVSLILEQ
ncbi:MAG: biotin--[acetyl-CoA-carboxylase] ligase [Rickettsiaceae bacterium]|nr:MAG: biotin--[acetyl-CoA-carboxylase] ligase [Rickettsiaceae bacterium]